MTLSDLASIGSFVSAVAVVISLAYLASQVRQARRHQQAAIRAERATRLATMNTAAEDPSIAEAILKGLRGGADISEIQYAQFTHFCRASFYNAEDTYFQHKEGLLTAEVFASFVASVKGWAARAPGIRAAWRQFRGLFVSEFAEWMDRTLAEVSPSPPTPSPSGARWWRKSAAGRRGDQGHWPTTARNRASVPVSTQGDPFLGPVRLAARDFLLRCSMPASF